MYKYFGASKQRNERRAHNSNTSKCLSLSITMTIVWFYTLYFDCNMELYYRFVNQRQEVCGFGKSKYAPNVVVVVVLKLSRRTRLLQGDIIKVEACCRNFLHFLVKTEC